jgi:SAM-dependent methyltransferase
MDTLSWARMGAQATGVDFSGDAIALAQSLSKELNIPARFLCCDLYDLPTQLDEQFDIVYTSYGVLAWLSDLTAWGKLAARYVKPGGIFYIAEFHPFAMMFDEQAMEPCLRYPYFGKEVIESQVQGSYADFNAHVDTKVAYEWPYTMGEVVTSLCQAGLEIEFLHEFPYTVYQQLLYLPHHDEHYWVQPDRNPEIPLMFSIKARKGE